MLHSRVYAQKTPDKPAYIMAKDGEITTYRQLEENCNRCTRLFRDIGLFPKDHIAVLMENNSHYLEVITAAQVAGLCYTTISTHLKTSEIEYIINDCQAKCFITSKSMADVASDLLGRIPAAEHRFMVGGVIDGYDSYEDKTDGYPITPIPECIEGIDILYSSGTTGRPKGIIQTHEDLALGTVDSGTKVLIEINGLNAETVYLSPAPLYHAAPLRFCMLTLRMGGTAVVMDRFDAAAALALIEKYSITHSQWVPTMFIRMLKLGQEERNHYDLSSMKKAIHAAAPCPVPVKEQMIDWWGPILFEYYSGTEGNTLTAIDSEEWLLHKGSVGRCYIGNLHILDDDGNELPQGESGGIYVEGGNSFEYHNDSEKTSIAHNEKGWSTIGDVGYLDKEGYLFLTDRKSNMIISGGVNIYPQETENVLAMHPKVFDVAVIGMPDEDFGEAVKAVVQPVKMDETGSQFEEELISYCRERLSGIKCPKHVEFVSSLPRTPTGKLVKRLLK